MANIAEAVNELKQERSRMVGQVRKLDKAIVVLRLLVGRNGLRPAVKKTGTKRRTMSAAGRRKIAAAQRARWAKWKAEQRKKAA
jgi:hypothetical protein